MKNRLKKTFSLAALAFGGTGTVFGGLGLLSGGFRSESVDLTTPGIALTAISALIFAAGYKGLKSTFANTPPKGPNP